MKSVFIFKPLFLQLGFVYLILNLASCFDQKPHEKNSLAKKQAIKRPVIITGGAPAVVRLDTCFPPYYAVMPVKDSVVHVYNTLKGPYSVKLGPATIKTSDFFITMPNYNAENGLAINSIMSSYCDKKGVLWFGTHGGGVTRYDGSSSVTFSTSQNIGKNDIHCIGEDDENNIWLGTSGAGVSKYDGKSFTNFTTAQGLASNYVESVTIDKEKNIWFSTSGGISSFDGSVFKNFTTKDGLTSNNVICSLQDKNGNLWFGTNDNGVSKFDGKEFTNYTKADGLVDNRIVSMLEDRNGNLWFGGGRGVSQFNGKSFFNITREVGSDRYSVHSIVQDDEGNIWFGTYGDGVVRYDGRSFLNINSNQGLALNVIRSIVKDKSGNLWFGTYGQGVSCYTGNSITSFTTNQGLSDNKIWGIMEDSDKNLWFCTDAQGVCKYDGNRITHLTHAQGLYNANGRCIYEDSKRGLWIGTRTGVSYFNGKSFTNYTTRHGLPGNNISHIIEDRLGNMWFALEDGGLSKFDGKVFRNYSTIQGLPGNDVRVILENDKGCFWIGLHGGGISYFNGRSFINFNTEQGLVDDFVFTLIKDRNGNIWIGTGDGGISIMHKEIVQQIEDGAELKAGDQLFENFSAKDGLSDDAAYDVVEDSMGNIIIGTNLGLTVIKNGLSPTQKKIEKDQIEYYHWKAGYPIKDINAESMLVDSKGYIWVGTGQKLIKFDYRAIHKNINPPVVQIKQLKANNQPIGWYNLLAAKNVKINDSAQHQKLVNSILAEEAIIYGKAQDENIRDSMQKKFKGIAFDSITPFNPLPVHLVLPYKYNTVVFDFAAIEPARPGQVRYQYILENYDQEWSPVTTQTSATFGNIYEGNYTFKVKAQSPDGIWSEPVEYSFKVLPPLWRSKGFIFLYIIATGTILFFIIRYRVASVRKKEQEKAKHEKDLLELEAKALRAQMNPHFIFNCMNSIKSLIQQHEEEKSVNYLTTFSKLIRTLFNNADKKEISLYDEIETCKLYLRLEAMRFDAKFSYAVAIDENIDLKSIQVPALIIQPFIENAIWHGIVPKGANGNIELTVKQRSDAVEIIIDDNGIGREASLQNKTEAKIGHQSKGVNLTQSRIELNNLLQQRKAKLDIIDKKNEIDKSLGTTVVITIKEE